MGVLLEDSKEVRRMLRERDCGQISIGFVGPFARVRKIVVQGLYSTAVPSDVGTSASSLSALHFVHTFPTRAQS